MPVINWQTTIIDGKEFLVIDVAKLRIPLEWDPNSNVFIAVAAPDGGILNHPALVQGDPGATPQIDTTIDFTPLEPDDDTADWASFVETAPNVYKLSLGLHKGANGVDGSLTLNPSSFGTPLAGMMLVVDSAGTGFELMQQKVPTKSFVPADINSTPSGNPAYTLRAVAIDAQPFDWYPDVRAQTVITGTGSDVRADLIARLGTTGISTPEVSGHIVGRGFGMLGANTAGIPTVISSARPAGSADSYGKVLAGNAAVVYVRVERQAGANTFTTDDDTTIIEVTPRPVM